MNETTKKLNTSIKIAVLGAIAFILMFIEIPVIPMFPWLKMDLSEIPVLMGAFAFGPFAGLAVEVLKIVLHLMIKGTSTGGVGELANILVGAALVMPAAFIYGRKKNKKSAIVGMVVGTIAMEVFGIIANVYLLLPAFGMKMESSELIQYVMAGLIPFNGIKAILVCIVTFILYKRVSAAVFKVQSNFDEKRKISKEI